LGRKAIWEGKLFRKDSYLGREGKLFGKESYLGKKAI